MDSITKDFIAFAEHMGDMAGRDTLESRITAILYLEPGDIAMDDLARMTGYSLASVCNKIRKLEGAGLITRKTRPGTKKIFLYMEKDSVRMLKNILTSVANTRLKYVQQHLPEIIARHKGKASPAKIALLERHLHCIVKMDRLIDDLITQLDKVNPP